jgi:hypothetical protein
MTTVPVGVHRTGPLPAAADYSKTLLHALVENDAEKDLQIGSVSQTQLLLMTLVERVHDAIYVLPRHARDASLGTALPGPAPDPLEYAKDVASLVKALEVSSQSLPSDELSEDAFQEKLLALNMELNQVRGESRLQLDRAKNAKNQIQNKLCQSYGIPSSETNIINTP